jgi:hypothetical protein
MNRIWAVVNCTRQLAKLSLFAFAALQAIKAEAGLVSLWEFNNSANLGQATIGTNLNIAGTAPAWSASQTYGSTTLNGVVNTVVGVPNHFIATHGIAPNGGGALVNQYSLLFDIRSPADPVWRTLFQTNETNGGDGDFFIRDSDNKLGVGSIGYTDFVMPNDEWKRVVLSVDLTAGGSFRTFIDGALVFTHGTSPLDGRHALNPTLLLFGDEDGENGLLSVGSVAIWDQALSVNQVAELGIAGAPITAVPEPSSLILAAAIGLGIVVTRSRRRRDR